MAVGMYWLDFVVAAAATNHAIDDCSLVIERLARNMAMDYCVVAFAQAFDRLVYAPVFAYVYESWLDFDGQHRFPLGFDQMNAVFAVTICVFDGQK